MNARPQLSRTSTTFPIQRRLPFEPHRMHKGQQCPSPLFSHAVACSRVRLIGGMDFRPTRPAFAIGDCAGQDANQSPREGE
jgi:hypothetical protein